MYWFEFFTGKLQKKIERHYFTRERITWAHEHITNYRTAFLARESLSLGKMHQINVLFSETRGIYHEFKVQPMQNVKD